MKLISEISFESITRATAAVLHELAAICLLGNERDLSDRVEYERQFAYFTGEFAGFEDGRRIFLDDSANSWLCELRLQPSACPRGSSGGDIAGSTNSAKGETT